jgi:prepilin-type N-terminal cleavage/methylation domain-containing protein/prepilin-type processing-associated H-X9-DG protein
MSAGFTLVEVLTVCAIVSVLMAILSPVLARAREQARQTTCLSNERQLGLALLMYVQDHDDILPNGVNRNGEGRMWPGEGWGGQCFAYVRSPALYRCPSDFAGAPESRHDQTVSYGFNTNLVGYADSDEDPIPSGRAFGALTAPSRSVLLFEVAGVTANVTDVREGAGAKGLLGAAFSAAGNGLDNRLYAQPDWSTSIEDQYATGYLGGRPPFDPEATQFASPHGRHGTGSNFLLADGHVRFLDGSRVSSGRSATQENCGQDNQPPLPGCDGMFRAAGTGNSSAFAATFSAL